jgi:pyridoxamine 5'-phosphate oxidase
MNTETDQTLNAERREYHFGALDRSDLDDDPIKQFERWLEVARHEQVRDATAMTLATVDSDNMPYQRMVLLKGFDHQGFVFFTNLASLKAKHIQHDNHVSLHFSWLTLDRQIMIVGKTVPLNKAEKMRYFLSRPRESQLAALASHQSHPITARRILEEKFLELKKHFMTVIYRRQILGRFQGATDRY